jgi:sulfur carrier protein ThiS
MPDCSYCTQSFDTEDAYRDHLAETHTDEMGRIDRRRVSDRLDSEEQRLSAGLIVGAILGVLLIGGGAYVLFTGGTGSGGATASGGQPSALGSIHIHGSMVMTVDGERIDFSKEKYQVQDRYFHFEGGNGDRWHVHGKGVTLQYGMQTLGINVTNNSVTFNGTTYRDGNPNTSVTVAVNGEPVNPATYVLKDGDSIRITANRTS